MIDDLGIQYFDIRLTTLQDMINAELYWEKYMEKIWIYADLSLKEYNFIWALEILEKDIRQAKFTLVKYKNYDTYVLIGLEELLSEFEEFTLKVASLSANNFAKHHSDKIAWIDWDIKVSREFLAEWVKI